MSPAPRRSVAYVLPVYDEGSGIAAFHHDLVDAASCRADLDLEFVYVDDGSRDDSLARLLELRADDPRVTVLALSRNHGHQLALTAGLDLCSGAQILIIDADLQEPPELLDEMRRVMAEAEADVVYAVRRRR